MNAENPNLPLISTDTTDPEIGNQFMNESSSRFPAPSALLCGLCGEVLVLPFFVFLCALGVLCGAMLLRYASDIKTVEIEMTHYLLLRAGR